MSQYFSSVPDEGGNIDKRKDLVGFRGSIGRHPRWRTGQFFVGRGEPRFHHKDLPAAEVAPRKQLGAPCSPSPHSALSLHPTTWSDRGAFKTLLAAHAQLFVCSWEFLRKKKKEEETCRRPGERWGGRLTFAAATSGVQGRLPAEAPRPEWVSPPWAPRRGPHLGTHSQRCPPAGWARGGVPGPRQGPGETTAPAPRGE